MISVPAQQHGKQQVLAEYSICFTWKTQSVTHLEQLVLCLGSSYRVFSVSLFSCCLMSVFYDVVDEDVKGSVKTMYLMYLCTDFIYDIGLVHARICIACFPKHDSK